MLSVRDVADKLDIRAERVRGLIRAGRLRALNLSPNVAAPRYVIDPADLDRFIENASRPPEPPTRTQPTPRRPRKREIDPDALALLDRVMARRRKRTA